MRDGQRALVVFNNTYGETSGTLRVAAVTGASLAQSLDIRGGADDWLLMRDVRNGLEHLRPAKELVEHGLRLTLHAYECQAYVEMRDVHDADGRLRRLAEWLGGRGVSSIDDALLEMDLAPLHDALRRGDQQGALVAAADRLGVEAPVSESKSSEADALPIGRSLEALVAANAPDMSRGKWIYDWLVDRVWPEADLVALMLDSEAAATGSARGRTPRGNGRKPLQLLADDRFRRAIGVNEHEGVAWFNQERFDNAVTWLELPNAAELRRAAKQAGYRLDKLEAALAEPPAWASTRPVRTSPRRAATPIAQSATSTAATTKTAALKKSTSPTTRRAPKK
jgi:hypothetical protein